MLRIEPLLDAPHYRQAASPDEPQTSARGEIAVPRGTTARPDCRRTAATMGRNLMVQQRPGVVGGASVAAHA